jgi:hypothetical protein
MVFQARGESTASNGTPMPTLLRRLSSSRPSRNPDSRGRKPRFCGRTGLPPPAVRSVNSPHSDLGVVDSSFIREFGFRHGSITCGVQTRQSPRSLARKKGTGTIFGGRSDLRVGNLKRYCAAVFGAAPMGLLCRNGVLFVRAQSFLVRNHSFRPDTILFRLAQFFSTRIDSFQPRAILFGSNRFFSGSRNSFRLE